jgi:NAD(P)-dependent dehydrogenase (short-subunit alcohol dehydrogenase family)
VVNTALWKMSDEEREKMMLEMGKKCATGRAGQPEDVAESYLAILNDGNMTGGMVRTDGGRSCEVGVELSVGKRVSVM